MFYMLIPFVFVLFCVSEYYFLWKKNSKGVKNRVYSVNGMLLTYVYRVSYPPDYIVERLHFKREDDRLFYRFDEHTLEIEFLDPERSLLRNKDIPGALFQLEMEETKEGCILYVRKKRVCISNAAGRVNCLMNTFWIEKISAQPEEVMRPWYRMIQQRMK